MKKIKVAYVCVHNSCRSQMAEALTNLYHSDFFEAYSAGTETKDQINQDAVKVIKKIHNFDMNLKHKSKLIDKIPEVDIVITMGCNVTCPWLPCNYREDWGLDDPSGKSEEEFVKTQEIIFNKIKSLKERILSKEIVV
tara:strand:+ start:4658 stop:5071 length:414 start_codon:yes stop_codon:yes gene_type:complete